MVTASTTAGISGIAGAATSVAGIIQTIMAAQQQAKAAKELVRASEREFSALQGEAAEIERLAYQRAVAALEDIAFLNATVDGNIRRLNREGTLLEGEIIAQTAASGLEFVGSPVLAAAAAAGEVARAVGNEELTRSIGVRQLRFASEEELRRAQSARLAAQTTIEGLRNVRSAQGAALQAQSLRTTLQGVSQAGALVSNPTIHSALGDLFPAKRTAPTVLGATAPGTTVYGP